MMQWATALKDVPLLGEGRNRAWAFQPAPSYLRVSHSQNVFQGHLESGSAVTHLSLPRVEVRGSDSASAAILECRDCYSTIQGSQWVKCDCYSTIQGSQWVNRFLSPVTQGNPKVVLQPPRKGASKAYSISNFTSPSRSFLECLAEDRGLWSVNVEWKSRTLVTGKGCVDKQRANAWAFIGQILSGYQGKMLIRDQNVLLN